MLSHFLNVEHSNISLYKLGKNMITAKCTNNRVPMHSRGGSQEGGGLVGQDPPFWGDQNFKKRDNRRVNSTG